MSKGFPICYEMAEKNENTHTHRHTDTHFRFYISRDTFFHFCVRNKLLLHSTNDLYMTSTINLYSPIRQRHSILAEPDRQGCQIWHSNWVRLAPNGTNLGLFKISFSTFWLAEPKCTERDLKKSQICPIRGDSDPI